MKILQGKIAVITGASSGIGRAITLMLAAEGATVCLIGRSDSRLKQVADEAKLHGVQVESFVMDLAEAEDMAELSEKLKKTFSRVNILIHSAGAISLNTIEDASLKDFDWQYHVNVRGPYQLTQALLPLIIPCQGQIVFINSTAGIMSARASVGQYAATKHALRAIADSVRDEVNDKGVRVLSVYPGRTASAMQANIHEKEGRPYHPEQLMQPEDVASVVQTALCLPGTAEMTDVSIRPMRQLKQ